MIQHSHARTMAEQRWGRGGTHSYRTNRPGAFYFSCSGHGGFVIDARAFTEDELVQIREYLSPEIATEVVQNATGKIVRFRGPEGRRNLKYRMHSESVGYPEIFFAEEDADWSVVAVFAGILIEGMTREGAIECFLRHHDVPESLRSKLDAELDEIKAAARA